MRFRQLLFSMVVVASTGACGGPSGPPPEPTPVTVKPTIVLISLDTFRQDHLGAYVGAGSDSLTPTLDAFSREAVLFEDCFAPIPFTLPSHLSMFTGLYPDVHGVERANAALGEHVPTLPALLDEAGYRTLGLAANSWMKKDFGFGRGFDHYELLPFELTFSENLNRRLGELLDQPENQVEPLFLFLHYFDAHSDFHNTGDNTLPYYAPPALLEELGIEEGARRFCSPAGECATDLLLAANQDPSLIDEGLLAEIRALYEVGVRYLDRDLGRLFDDLKARGLWDSSLIIVTADHGEPFREHGEFIHNQAYTEDLAVPLMIRLPGGRHGGERRRGLTETVDLLPTILTLAGVEIPADVQGRSLTGLLDDREEGKAMALGRHKTAPRRYALRDPRFTLYHDLDSGVSELYDRKVDPEERRDHSQTRPDEVARLLAGLEDLLAVNQRRADELASAEVGAALVSAEEAEQLRAIGYTDVGTEAGAEADDGGR